MDPRDQGKARPPGLDAASAFRLALLVGLALTATRIAVLFATPLELYPDEAQYWLWSRELHWGYVSKPPMIAWLIAATTAIGGDREAWVRLAAPMVHLGAMLALFPPARRLYGPAAALLASLLYGLMPAVQVSALFIATDAPLMLFLALALWAYVALQQAPGRRTAAAALGAALGLAFLAKLAAAYLVLGMVLHAVLDPKARAAWRGGAWAITAAVAGLLFAPNLVWQATHGFATVAHTTEVNAGWSPASLFHPGRLLEFLAGQLGVLGPVPFVALIAGAILGIRRRSLSGEDRMLLCLALPPLLLVSIQALLSRAHAHWAAAGYPAAAVLVSAWLLRWKARRWIAFGLGLEALVAAVLAIAVAVPSIADQAGMGRRWARHRGWAETARLVAAAARAQQQERGLGAVVVEDRYLFNELAYYGRGYFRSPGAAPLRMRPPEGPALNEAELSSALRPWEGRRALIAETAGLPPVQRLPSDFTGAQPLGRWTLPLGGRKTRELELWLGVGYRGPGAVTGPPTPL